MDKDWSRRGWATVFILVCLLGSTISIAWAHVNLLTAIPEPGSTLTAPPAEVRLTFDGDIDASHSQIALFNEAFQAVPDVVTLPPDTEDKTQLAAAVTSLDPGRYTVQWVVTSTDGHSLRGSYAFMLAETPVFHNFSEQLLLVLLLVIVGVAGLVALYRIRKNQTG